MSFLKKLFSKEETKNSEELRKDISFQREGGNFDKALTLSNRLTAAYPDDPLSWIEQGMTHDALGDFEDAIEDFTKAMELQPGFDIPLYARASTKLHAEMFEGAAEDFAELAATDSNLASEAWYKRGLAVQYLHDDAEAEKCFLKAIEVDEDHKPAIYTLGCLYNNHKRYEEGILQFNKLLDVQGFPDGFFNRGFARYHLGLFEEAMDDFESILKMEALAPDAYYYIGLCAHELGDHEGALDAWHVAANAGYKDAIERVKSEE